MSCSSHITILCNIIIDNKKGCKKPCKKWEFSTGLDWRLKDTVYTWYILSVSSSNIHVEILMSKLMVLKCRTFGKWLGHVDEAIMNGISALIRRHTREIMSLTPPWEKTERKWLFANQGVASHQIPNLLAPWSWTFRHLNYEENKILLFK